MRPVRRWTMGCVFLWLVGITTSAVSFQMLRDLIPAQSQEIFGRVTDKKGTGVPAVVVEVLRNGETERATTDDEGRFHFYYVDLEKGVCLLRIAMPGVKSDATPITRDTERFAAVADRYKVEGWVSPQRPIVFRPWLRPSNMTPGPEPEVPPPTTAQVPVFFATDRAQSVPRKLIGFGDTPSPAGSPLTLGECVVSVPVTRHVLGELERPTWWTLDWGNWSENPERHFVIVALAVLGKESFWTAVQDQANHAPDGEALVFIHGYNVSFGDAVLRTAQLAWDLSFKGAPIVYSWPSDGHTLAYVADKEANEGTVHAAPGLPAVPAHADPSQAHSHHCSQHGQPSFGAGSVPNCP